MAELDHRRIQISDLDAWPSDLVFATLEELTTNLDTFLDRMDDILEAGRPKGTTKDVDVQSKECFASN